MPAPQSPNDLTRHQLDELDMLLQRMLKLPLASPTNEPAPSPVPIPRPDLPSGWRVDAPANAAPRTAHLPEPAARPVMATAPLQEVESTRPHTAFEMPQWGPDPLARYNPSIEPENSTPLNPEKLRLFGPPDADSSVPLSTQPMPTTGTLRGVDAPATPAGFRSRLAELTAPEPAPEPEPVRTPRPFIPIEVEPIEPVSQSVPLPLMPLYLLNMLLEGVLSLFGPVGQMLTSPLGKNALAFVGLLLIIGAAAWSAQGLGFVKLPGLR